MKIKFPPNHPLEAGPHLGSRVFEFLPPLTPLVTYVVMMWAGLLFYFTDISGAEQTYALFSKYGVVSLYELQHHAWWRLVTSAFLHGDILHIVFNLMWIYQLMPLLERALGSLKTLLFVFYTAAVSSAYSMALEHDISSPFGITIGLSGVVFALIGFMWTAWPRWTGFLEKFRGHTVQFVLFMQGIFFLLALFGGSVMKISNAGHVSGMIVGAMLGQWACRGNKLWLIAALLFGFAGPALIYAKLAPFR